MFKNKKNNEGMILAYQRLDILYRVTEGSDTVYRLNKVIEWLEDIKIIYLTQLLPYIDYKSLLMDKTYRLYRVIKGLDIHITHGSDM